MKILFLLCLFFSLNGKEVYIESNQAQIFCTVMGQGDPLVIIHGGPGLSHDYLLPHMEQLAEKNLVIFYDQRACGASTGDAETINVEAYLSDIEAIRTSFGFEKINLLGHSWGGYLAFRFAIDHPESVNKLILSNSMPASSEGLALFLQNFEKAIVAYSEDLKNITNSEEFKNLNPSAVEKYYQSVFKVYCFDPTNIERVNLKLSQRACLNGAKVNDILVKSVFMQQYDFHELLKKLPMKTLVIHGESDLIPISASQKIADSITNSKLLMIKECGHFPYVESPGVYFKEINQFFAY